MKFNKPQILKVTLCSSFTKDPDRDCSNFDPLQRAQELFEALDVDGDGTVTEDEFVNGCLKDEVFVMLLDKFSGDNIWGL